MTLPVTPVRDRASQHRRQQSENLHRQSAAAAPHSDMNANDPSRWSPYETPLQDPSARNAQRSRSSCDLRKCGEDACEVGGQVVSRVIASVPSFRAVPRAPTQLCPSPAPPRHPPHWIRTSGGRSAPPVDRTTLPAGQHHRQPRGRGARLHPTFRTLNEAGPFSFANAFTAFTNVYKRRLAPANEPKKQGLFVCKFVCDILYVNLYVFGISVPARSGLN